MIPFRVASTSSPLDHYLVRCYTGIETDYGQNEWTCTCKSFRFRGTCKHIEKARAALYEGGILSIGAHTVNPSARKE